MSEINVRVVDRGRRYFYLRYRDPVTGRNVEKSSEVETGGKAQRRKAEKEAAVWEADLKAGRYKSPSRVTWAEFLDRYDREHLSSLADGTHSKAWAVFNSVTEILRPARLASLTAEAISRYATELRKKGRAESTIQSNLQHLKAALNWAVEMEILPEAPKIRMPKRAKNSKVMRGRAVTSEEFERMLGKVSAVVGEEVSESWRHFLTGLWWSSLRLTEALTLTWDNWGDGLIVDTSGKYVMLRIPAEAEKGNKDRVYPVAPEFAEFLLATPENERSGFVFNPVPSRIIRGNRRAGKDTACRTVTRIGEAAGVVVDRKNLPDGTQKTSFGSAHDLRRAFGFRWSRRVMPAVLKELMRHEDISTTMKYYVGLNAESTAEALYAAVSGDTSGDTTPTEATIKTT